MAIIKCKMCGGDIELSENRTLGTCEYCGSTMTLPKVGDEQRAATFNRGNYFRRIGEFDKALSIYEQIVNEDDTDAEAHWCCTLCRFGIEYVEDPVSHEWLPTCHRASFDNILENVDFLSAVEHSDGPTAAHYKAEAEKIARVQRDILRLSQSEQPFDVFICYKESDENGERTKDSVLAQEIYYQLTDKGLRVFFARITLEDKVGTEYEPYIFAALNSAKVMVVVGTKAEYVNAVWVKNEWSRFLSLMKHDRSKLLLPCYRDMDPYDLPDQLAMLQAYDMGKIGFMQDLIRGISKVLGVSRESLITSEKKSRPARNEDGSTNSALLRRATMALEDGDWEKADAYFERVLDNDAECAAAYAGEFLAQQKQASLESYAEGVLKSMADLHGTQIMAVSEDREHVTAALQRFCRSKGLSLPKDMVLNKYYFDRSFHSITDEQKKMRERIAQELNINRSLKRARQFASDEYRKKIDAFKTDLLTDMDEMISASQKKDEEKRTSIQTAYREHIKATDAALRSLYASKRLQWIAKRAFKFFIKAVGTIIVVLFVLVLLAIFLA